MHLKIEKILFSSICVIVTTVFKLHQKHFSFVGKNTTLQIGLELEITKIEVPSLST